MNEHIYKEALRRYRKRRKCSSEELIITRAWIHTTSSNYKLEDHMPRFIELYKEVELEYKINQFLDD